MKQNFIELITVPFNAGESKLFAISGQYFELIDATNPVDVLLSDVNGAQRGVMRSAEASFNLKDTDFATVQLYSATAQTIRFAYGTGEAGTRRAAGAVSIVGDVALNPATLAALESTDLNAATLNALTRPLAPTASWSAYGAFTANSNETIFAAGANVNGAIVLEAYVDGVGTAIMAPAFLAKSTAPASVVDGQVVFKGPLLTFAGSLYFVGGETLQHPVFVPAGRGLYFRSDVSNTNGGGYRYCNYVLL